MRAADKALLEAKREGKAQVTVAATARGRRGALRRRGVGDDPKTGKP